jgi:Fe2+ transport system protein B
LFTSFPYLLPCLVSAFISFVGLVTGFFFLKETLKKENTKIQENDENQKESLISETNGTNQQIENEHDKRIELLTLTINKNQNNEQNQQEQEYEREDETQEKREEEIELKELILKKESDEMKRTQPSLLHRCCRHLPCFRLRPQTLRYLLTTKVSCCLTMFTLLVLNFQMFEQAFALLL